MRSVADRHVRTDLLLIITSTAGQLSGGTINIDNLERRWTPKINVFSKLFTISGCHTHLKSKLRCHHWMEI